MTLVSEDKTGDVADEIQVLSARIASLKAGTQARAEAITSVAREIEHRQTTPPAGPGLRRSRRNVSVALLLVLLAAGVTVIIASRGGSENPPSNSTGVTAAPASVNQLSPPATGAQSTSPPSGVSPEAVTQGTSPPSASAQGLLPPSNPTAADAATSVVVELGESFWAIAERRVASAQSGAPTTAEVASYWVELVAANQDRLAHAGNPDLIYPGQTFFLP